MGRGEGGGKERGVEGERDRVEGERDRSADRQAKT